MPTVLVVGNKEDKLLPAMQTWQQELGTGFLSEFERVPRSLHLKPAEELLKHQYLTSIGIKSPERLRKCAPHAFDQSLTSMQSKVAFLQYWGLSTAQTLSLIQNFFGSSQMSWHAHLSTLEMY